jgi:hypothetical protein
MQRTEPEFEQAQAFEVGVAYPTPQTRSPLDLHYPLANFLWLMPQFVTAQLPR